MEKEYVDDDEPRRVLPVQVNRFGFAKSELNSAHVIVKRRSAFEYDRQAYFILKRVLVCRIICISVSAACASPECLIMLWIVVSSTSCTAKSGPNLAVRDK